jgi:hypothetical protein
MNIKWLISKNMFVDELTKPLIKFMFERFRTLIEL